MYKSRVQKGATDLRKGLLLIGKMRHIARPLFVFAIVGVEFSAIR